VHAAEGKSLLGMMQESLDDSGEHGEGIASLPQRLLQISYGYHQALSRPGPDPDAPAGTLRTGYAQLEAPLQHSKTWELLPVRKPLLTKRSRRCRLNKLEDEGQPAPARPSARGTGAPAENAASTICKNIVVKPQINPCSNPPFQKNNVAVSFVPRCVPWAWCLDGPVKAGAGAVKSTAPEPPGLHLGEDAELVFSMSNPLDTDVELKFDPSAFNPGADTPAAIRHNDVMATVRPVGEQNVEVLTKPFETVIARFNDLADVHEAWTEDDKSRSLKEKDDPDVIPERKLHKILVRLRFRCVVAASADQEFTPWVFFVRLVLAFTDASSARHEVKLVLRFSLAATDGRVNG